MPTHWQEMASEYDAVMGRDPTMEAMHEAIMLEIPERLDGLLDLGSGTGTLLAKILKRFSASRVFGLDPAPAMIDESKKKLGLLGAEFILGSAADIGAPSDSFDCVISNFALHHLTHREKDACAREICRVLKPGGRLVYGDQHVPRMGEPDDLDWVEEVFDFFSNKARYYLRNAGLERMLVQIRLLPRFLLLDGEIPATIEYWRTCLEDGGMTVRKVVFVGPEILMHTIIVAEKPLS